MVKINIRFIIKYQPEKTHSGLISTLNAHCVRIKVQLLKENPVS